MLAYREWAPDGGAADLIRCVWSLRGQADGGPADPIVSDGCVELVFNLADPFEQIVDDASRTQPLAMAVGPTTQPTVVRPTGRIDVLGVRLQPWAGQSALGVPMNELRDRCVAIGALTNIGKTALTELPERLSD